MVHEIDGLHCFGGCLPIDLFAGFLLQEVPIPVGVPSPVQSFCIINRAVLRQHMPILIFKRSHARVPDFLVQNNRDANRVVCDHENIYIQNVKQLSQYEKLAILATHTGNVSVHSFAAEIRYHAMFLTKLLKIRLPIAGSPYASAVRADMSIGDKEFHGPTPYYDLSGKLVSEQVKYHQEQLFSL